MVPPTPPSSPRLRRTGLGYAVGHGPHLAPGEPAAERDSFGDVVLVERLREAIWRLNPAIPEEVEKNVLSRELPSTLSANLN